MTLMACGRGKGNGGGGTEPGFNLSDDAYSTDEDTLLSVAAPGVLGNDTDVDGDPLTAVLNTGPGNGTLTLNADGSFGYTPNANFNGSDTFTYFANDGVDDSPTAATVTLTVNAVNDDVPVANNDAYSTDEDTLLSLAAPGVLGNDTDVDGDPLTAVLNTGPGNGTLTLNADGSFGYTPDANFNGSDTFTYFANDGVDDSPTAATVTLTVNAVNDVPVANNDAYSTFGNTALEVGVPPGTAIAVRITGSVLDNDIAEAGGSLTVTGVTPGTGSVVMNADGSFDYSPAAGQIGVDTFSYQVTDGTDTVSADVTITLDNRVWYVDNTSAGTQGTSIDPFSTLLQAEGVAQPGDTIYIAHGDGTTSGLDNGLTLAVDNVTVIGEGADLVVNSITLASAGATPILTNSSGVGITLNSANNILIMGLNIDGVLSDGLEMINSTGVILEAITISNSGESAIQGSGADVGLILTDVIIDSVDVVDPSVSDDAIFIAPTSSASLVMSGGSISGVPGNLGDGIEFENASSSNVVSMDLDIRSVNFSNITQDGIKLDNDNGVINAQIGGPTLTEGNEIDVGFRGIQIQTDADPTLTRTNSIMIQNNTITSANESIQIRSIQDSTHLSILDNVVNRAVPASISDLIDVQAELNSNTQARINRNDISNLGGSDGIKLRVIDQASLTMEALNNAIDAPDEGFDFDVIETDVAALDSTILNSTILTNTLSNIGSAAMNATNVSSTSKTCLDLQGNSPAADYEVDATNGSFELTTVSQTIALLGGSYSVPASDTCPVPTF